MPGYIQSPLGIVQQLRDNLHNRYRDEFCILKELVQNANDAEAKRMVIGWANEFPCEGHPLFRAPGVFVVNDGPVEPSDLQAVQYFGLSNKAADSGSVGKFGLGMKSVFHVCEAFFYLHRNGKVLNADFLNPWAYPADWRGKAEGKHQDWEKAWPSVQDEAAAAFARWLGALVEKWPQWFALWLPLRAQRLCAKVDPILEKYPGDEDQPPAEMIRATIGQDLAAMLPLLDSLEELAICDGTGPGLSTVGHIHFEPGFQRRKWRSVESEGRLRRMVRGLKERNQEARVDPFSGTIAIAHDGERSLAYTGREFCSRSPEFRNLKQSTFWPKSGGIDQRTGKEEQTPDKGEPHAAVCFMQVPPPPGRSPTLTVNHCVFLPLSGEQMSETLPISCDTSFVINLHGFYFIDAGRQGIQFASDRRKEVDALRDESDVRRQWNTALMHEVVLPLVLPAFSAFVNERGLAYDDVEGLTRGLAESSAVKPFLGRVCSHSNWVCRYDGKGWQWEIVPAEEPLREIPQIAERDRGLVPVLWKAASGGGAVLVASATPRLVAPGTSVSWSPGELAVGLRGLSGEKATDIARLRVGSALLSLHSSEETRVGPELSGGLRSFLASILARALPKGDEAKGLFRSLVKRLPPARVHVVECRHPGRSEGLWSALNAQARFALLLPSEFVSEQDIDHSRHTDRASYSAEEAEALLALLRDSFAGRGLEADPNDIQAVVLEILAACRDLDLSSVDRWPLLRTEPIGGERSNCSLSQLRAAHGVGRLFRSGGTTVSIIGALNEAVCEQFYVVGPITADALFGAEEIPFASRDTVFAMLSQRPRLAPDPRDRLKLFEQLLSEINQEADTGRLQALRYLLHGSAQRYDDESPLLHFSHEVSDDVWRQLAEAALTNQAAQWRVVPAELGNALNGRQMKALEVSGLDPKAVLCLIGDAGPANMDFAGLTDTDCEIILGSVNPEMPLGPSPGTARDVLLEMPIFVALDGTHCVPDEHTYVESETPVPEALGRAVTLVRRSKNRTALRNLLLAVPEWDSAAVVSEGLNHAKPWQQGVWDHIAGAISALDSQVWNLLREPLAATSWLPISEVIGVAPADVFSFTGNKRDDGDIDERFCFIDELPDSVREHSAHGRIRELFPSLRTAARRLGELLAADSAYHIGLLPVDSGQLSLDMLLAAFAEVGNEFMPIGPFLRRIAGQDRGGEELCIAELLPPLAQPMETRRLKGVLDALVDSAARELGANGKTLSPVYLHYLEEAARSDGFIEGFLPQLRLPNRRGVPCAANKLCLNARGVAPDFLLDRKVAGVLEKHVAAPSKSRKRRLKGELPLDLLELRGEELQAEIDASPERLRDYFQPWIARFPAEAVGLLAALLGDEPAMRAYAAEMLGNRHVEAVRDQIGWHVKDLEPEDVSESVDPDAFALPPETLELEDIHSAMAHQATVVSVVDEGMVTETSLTGTSITVPLGAAAELDDLFVGDRRRSCRVYWNPGLRSKRRAAWIQLRRLDPNQVEEAEFRRLLDGTIRTLVSSVYAHSADDLGDVLADLMESEQFEIDVARALLLENCFFYLRQLKTARQNPELKALLQSYDDARRQCIELKDSPDKTRQKADKRKRELQERLGELIISSEEAQACVRDAVRSKIHDEYQYSTESVLFELLQNADDACVEWSEATGQPYLDSSLAIAMRNGTLRVAHAGRPINHYRFPGFDGRGRAFDQDLEKMLVLSASTKGVDDGEAVTGKFGLGFKSVFLLTDRPRIMSGRLGCDIVGAMLPERLSHDEIGHQLDIAKGLLQRARGEGQVAPPTLFEFPLRPSVSPETVLGRFRGFLSLQLALTRRVRHCVLEEEGAATIRASWVPRVLQELPQIEVGDFPIGGRHNELPTRGLLFRMESGTVVFGLSPEGVVALPEDIPTLWVTTPTTCELRLGFVINGAFELDIGRANLAQRGEENDRIADAIGQELGRLLVAFFDAAERNWEATRAFLGLGAETTQRDLWQSLWQVLLDSSGRLQALRMNQGRWSLVRNALFQAQGQLRGVATLYNARNVLPTGLSGNHGVCTQLEPVRWIVSGLLDDDESAFTNVFCQDWARKVWPPGTIVSQERCRKVLDVILPAGAIGDVKTLDVAAVVQRIVGREHRVDPKHVSRLVWLGEVLRQKSQGVNCPWGDRERVATQSVLQRLQFLSASGEWESVGALLAEDDGSDDLEETRIASFAPSKYLLSDRYDQQGRDLFVLVRGPASTDVPRMSQWALHTHDSGRQRGVLAYLLNGEKGHEFGGTLAGKKTGTWLDSLLTCPAYGEFDPHEQSTIRGRLRVAMPAEDDWVLSFRSTTIDATTVLRRLYTWWGTNRESLLQQYHRQVYVDGRPPALSLADDPAELTPRKNWLLLLLLGAFHRMGRTGWEAHREFVRRCDHEQWLDVFAKPNPEGNSDDWMKVLDCFLEDERSDDGYYYNWMRQYVAIYQFSRWLGDYMQVFRDLQNYEKPFALDELLKPRSNPGYSGTGLDAPQLLRPLGMGAHFVVRELCRLGVVTNPHAYDHCFMPVERVRRLLESLGLTGLSGRNDESRQIREWLTEKLDGDMALFHGDFDVPLQMITLSKYETAREGLFAAG